MPTIRLNQENNFRANVTTTQNKIIFLVNGSAADCLVYQPVGEHLVGEAKNIQPGNTATINGVTVGQLAQVQINPKDSKLCNATVTY